MVKTRVCFAPTQLFVKRFGREAIEQAKEFAKRPWMREVEQTIELLKEQFKECEPVHKAIEANEAFFTREQVDKALVFGYLGGFLVGSLLAYLFYRRCALT
jgi:hypothetical protein